MQQEYKLQKFLSSPLPLAYLPYALLLFAALGFLDMTYLTIDHYRHFIPPCTIHGCDLVLTSGYATIAHIPVALLGALYFFGFMILAGVMLTMRQMHPQIRLFTFILSIVSLFVSIILVGLQAFVLHAFCQYCLFGELMFFLIFDTAWYLWYSHQN